MTPKEHNRLAGIFLLAHGAFQGFVLLIIGLVYGLLGIGLVAASPDREGAAVGGFFLVAIVFVALIGALFVVPQILGGLKLLRETPSARNWGIVGSVIACLSFPLGTAAGVYGLWFLFGDLGRSFYLDRGIGNMMIDQPPPPPNSWR